MHRRAFLTGVAATATGSTAIVRGQQNGGGSTHVVGMYQDGEGYYFDPIGLHVAPGDTVKWVSKSGAHSATSYSEGNPEVNGNVLIPKGAKGWNSGVLQPGKSFTHTFTTKGTYDYYCIPHKSLGMVARIVCGTPGGPAETESIPGSDEPESGVMPPSKAIVKKNSISFPYVPNVGHGGPPALFWGGVGVFSLTSVYLFSVYDRKSGRYDESSEAEFVLEDDTDSQDPSEK